MKHITKLIALALVATMLVVVLASCAPNSDPYKAKAALEEEGYTVVLLDNLEGEDGCIASLTASRGLFSGNHSMIQIFYYKDKASAKAAFADKEKESNEERDQEADWVCERSGKMIYFGNEAAVKHAR